MGLHGDAVLFARCHHNYRRELNRTFLMEK